jgi:hypothetical protein
MKIKTIAINITLVLLFSSCSMNSDIDIESKYSELVESEKLFMDAFNKENDERIESFSRAAVLMEETIQTENLNNGYLYYNLGNAWLNAGQLGKAILNYKKAQKRLPNNSNIKKNLQYARSLVVDDTKDDDDSVLLRTLFFLHYDTTFQVRMILLIGSSMIIFTCLSLWLFKKNKVFKNIIAVSTLFFTFFLSSIIIESNAKKEGVLVVPEVIARKGDSNGYESSFTSPLHRGVEFQLLDERNGWFHIELSDGSQCWIPGATALFVD